MDNEQKLKKQAKLWGGVALILVVLVLGIVYIVDNDNQNSNENKSSIVVNEDDWVRGDINTAKTVLVEYADFQCPACASYHNLVKSLEEKYPEDLAVVFKHFPLSQIHKNALLSSQAAEAAGIQGKFWEMHDMLFENQTEWSDANNAKEIFIGYAKELGLNESQFIVDIDSREIKDKISSSYTAGVKMGVNSTPSFFLDGNKIPNPRNFTEFENVVTRNF